MTKTCNKIAKTFAKMKMKTKCLFFGILMRPIENKMNIFVMAIVNDCNTCCFEITPVLLNI